MTLDLGKLGLLKIKRLQKHPKFLEKSRIEMLCKVVKQSGYKLFKAALNALLI